MRVQALSTVEAKVRALPAALFPGTRNRWFAVLTGTALAGLALGVPVLGQKEKPPSEKQLLAEFQTAFDSADAARRVAALSSLGERTRALENQGTSKAVAKALAKGLAEPELEVRDAAIVQLARGRDVDTVVETLSAFLKADMAELEKRVTRSDPESRERVSRGMVLFVNGCRALATYRDERSAASLAALLAGLPPLAEHDDLSARLAQPLAACALDLGCLEVVSAAVKLTRVFAGPKQEPAGRALHAALTEFATRLGGTLPPEWSENVSVKWSEWFEAHEAELPKKLGRLTTPPLGDPPRALDGLPGKSG